jgi:tRNA 2-thiouridine synthesizing protein A
MVVGRGATICVLATDPGSVADFTSFCAATGHRLLTSEHKDGVYLHVIEKA